MTTDRRQTFEPAAKLIHEVEAGYSPTCIAVIGARLDDAWFSRLRDDLMATDAGEGIHQHGPIMRSWWRPVTNDEDGLTIPLEQQVDAPVWWWDECDEDERYAVPVTHQEVRWHD